jgi:membrane-associated phospholipid phosphatase
MPKFLVTVVVIAGLWPVPMAVAQTPKARDLAQPPVEVTRPAVERTDGASVGSLFSELGREITRVPSDGTLFTLYWGGALALSSIHADRTLTQRAALSVPLDRVFEIGESTGNGWAQGGAALTTLLVASATGHPRLQTVGADLVQAQIVTSIVTHGLKIGVGRTRPDHGRFSFPSGHASATFANATVLQRHFGWKVGIPAYAFATYIAVSRLPANSHYLSDVIAGATMGIAAGRTVTVGRGPGRFTMAPTATPAGVAVAFHKVR